MNFDKYTNLVVAYIVTVLSIGMTALFLLGAYHFVKQIGWL